MRHESTEISARDKHFNSRTHVECDPTSSYLTSLIFPFQLTHSRGVRLRETGHQSGCRNFNSRTHVECDVLQDWVEVRYDISTHALTWSATMGLGKTYVGSEISTHALTWSATRSANRRTTKIKISTHALTWSATRCVGLLELAKHFNSRTHVECDEMKCS